MSNTIHETVLKDIVDLIGDAKDFADEGKKMFGKDTTFRSLTREANKLILVFPVLCTKGISIETASMITKAIEKRCVTLLHMLFASFQISDAENLTDFISKYHSNITVGDRITVDDFISFTDTISNSMTLAAEAGEIKIKDAELLENFKKCRNDFNNIMKTTLNEYALSNFECHKTYKGYEAVLEKKGDYPKTKPLNDKLDLVNKLSENDIKKANELIPTKVTVKFHSKETGHNVEGIIGVKCKLYTVDSLEVIQRISTKYADSNWVKELVRASTGEISFWRDLVFAIDRAKIDAINSSKKGSNAKMWKVLERRATKNRLQKWKANRADASPITTLVINQDEVEYLMKDYDINMENRNIAIKLMEAYNFMGLVIVDEPAETASFIWDEGNEANFETLSFRNLERESDDKNYRKVINLMTKISR